MTKSKKATTKNHASTHNNRNFSMTKSKEATTKNHASTHNNTADPGSHFAGNPLNDTRNHLKAVLERVNGICDGYEPRGAAAYEFAEWIPALVKLDKSLHEAMKVLSKWEFSVKVEILKKETKIELVDTWDPFGDFTVEEEPEPI
jgi:hypothetical protein